MDSIKDIIDSWDPIGLLSHAPNDEYDLEIEMIQQLLSSSETLEELADGIHTVFSKSFGKDIFMKSKEECKLIASKLLSAKEETDMH